MMTVLKIKKFQIIVQMRGMTHWKEKANKARIKLFQAMRILTPYIRKH